MDHAYCIPSGFYCLLHVWCFLPQDLHKWEVQAIPFHWQYVCGSESVQGHGAIHTHLGCQGPINTGTQAGIKVLQHEPSLSHQGYLVFIVRGWQLPSPPPDGWPLACWLLTTHTWPPQVWPAPHVCDSWRPTYVRSLTHSMHTVAACEDLYTAYVGTKALSLRGVKCI